jgi:hypothetical protein
MRSAHKVFVLLAAGIFLCPIGAFGQDDAPSLGDVARQARLQKQKDAQTTQPIKAGQNQNPSKDGQSKDGPGAATPAGANATPAAATPAGGASGNSPAKDGTEGKAKHVITNDEIPEHVGPTSTHPPNGPVQGTYVPTYYPPQVASAEQWKAGIQQMKNNIASVQQSISQVSASIQYAGGNCVANCVEWNEHQKQKQDQVEQMKQQIEQMQKTLEDMQDAARKQGFGSSVYDP